MSASSLSENPVFKRARGEKVLVGARPGLQNDMSEKRPISSTELEMRYYALQDGTESVYDDDFGDARKKKRKKSSVVVVEGTEGPDGGGTKRRAAQTGLRSDQLDSLVNEAAFGESSTGSRAGPAGEAADGAPQASRLLGAQARDGADLLGELPRAVGGHPCLQCFFTGACYGACGAAWSCWLVLRTLPRALRWAAFQRSQPEVRRGSQAALRCVAVWPSKSRGSMNRSPAAPGRLAAATNVSRAAC